MFNRQNWNNFNKSGLLWYVNTILKPLGWMIIIETNEDNNITDVYPVEIDYMPYEERINISGYKRFKKFLKSLSKKSEREVDL